MRSLVLAAILAALSVPALAAEPRIGGVAAEILGTEWAEPTTLHDYLFNPIAFDGPADGAGFALELSKLSEVSDVFGGDSHADELMEGTPLRWLCYDTGARRTWFVSFANGEDGEPVLNLIAEDADTSAAGCTANAEAATPLPGNDLPGLGASLADLAARFGVAAPDTNGHLAYVSETTLGDDGDSWVEMKTVYYRLENGKVAAVAYSQLSRR